MLDASRAVSHGCVQQIRGNEKLTHEMNLQVTRLNFTRLTPRLAVWRLVAVLLSLSAGGLRPGPLPETHANYRRLALAFLNEKMLT